MQKPGFFGSDGRYSFEAEVQIFTVAHLRNAYQKVGMFGGANASGLPLTRPFGLTAPVPPPFNGSRSRSARVTTRPWRRASSC